MLLALWLAAGAGGDGVRRLGLDQSHWRGHGFALMMPPVRLPTTHDGRDVIQVWLRVPEGQKIHARDLPDQARHTLVFPPGTRSDRVESLHLPAGEGASLTRPVCAARAYLFARMAAEGRRPFAREFGDCGLR